MAVVSIKNKLRRGNLLVGNTAYQIPGDFESIATVTVGSGGSSSVEFTSIPAVYEHLQLRYMWKPTSSAAVYFTLRFNNDTTTANYRYHFLSGDGSAVAAGTAQNAYSGENNDSSYPSVTILDVLNYANTNKYKTVRELTGFDTNGGGKCLFISDLWMSTSAITSIKLTINAQNIAQYSHFALYGIKGA